MSTRPAEKIDDHSDTQRSSGTEGSPPQLQRAKKKSPNSTPTSKSDGRTHQRAAKAAVKETTDQANRRKRHSFIMKTIFLSRIGNVNPPGGENRRPFRHTKKQRNRRQPAPTPAREEEKPELHAHLKE